MASVRHNEPDTQAGVSAEWLEKVLESYHARKCPQHDPEIEVVGWESAQQAEKLGFLSEPVAVAVRYTTRREHKQQHLFCKFMTQDQTFKDILMKNNMDVHEIKFYTELKPVLERIESHHLGAGQDSQWAPEFFFAESVAGGGYTLVLEDLASEGFVVDNNEAGLDAATTMMVLSTLAKFHAASVALEMTDKLSAEKMLPHVWETENIVELFTSNLKGSLNDALNLLKSQNNCQETCEAFQRFMRVDTTQVFNNAMKTSTKLNCFVHFDMWCNNIMVNRNSPDVRIIDWQNITHGSPALDVAMLLWSSVAPEVRRENGPQLKDHYWQALTTRLAQLGVQDLVYTRDDFLQDFARADVVACLMWIAFIELNLSLPGGEERCVKLMVDIFKTDFWNHLA